MIDNEKTLEKFGYTFDSVPLNSKRLVAVICDYCGDNSFPQKKSFVIGRRHLEIQKDSCYKCRNIKRSECINLFRPLEKLEKGIENDQKFCNACQTIKNKIEFFVNNKNKDKLSSQCKICMSKHEDPVRRRAIAKNYLDLNRDKVNARKREYRKINLNYKLASNISCRVRLAIKKELAEKCNSTMKLLGCSVEFLIKHIESQFTEGMSWETYGVKGWHIDHIIPCASFDLTIEENQYKCFNWTNLQPLWWKENISKSSFVDGKKTYYLF